MTIEQTRQLGIEFERRVQAMMPQEELENKLDTDTIYSYLNEYQMRYVTQLCNNASTAQIQRMIEPLVTSVDYRSADVYDAYVDRGSMIDGGLFHIVDKLIPEDFLLYISSNSEVLSGQFVSNQLGDQLAFIKVTDTVNNSDNILRHPLAILGGLDSSTKKPTITFLTDNNFGEASGFILWYYRKPKYMSLMTSTPCELPMQCFEDLVTGAVEMYITYVKGPIRQQEEEGRRQRFAERQAERNKLNEQ